MLYIFRLFGSEDVDLRSLGSTMAFSGPPPVIDGSLSKKLEAKAKNVRLQLFLTNF